MKNVDWDKVGAWVLRVLTLVAAIVAGLQAYSAGGKADEAKAQGVANGDNLAAVHQEVKGVRADHRKAIGLPPKE